MTEPRSARSAAIRDLNDQFRMTFVGGTVMLSAGVAALDESARAELLGAVRSYSTFDQDCDPFGEHDLGVVETAAGEFIWKIDSFDRELKWASPNPADPARTARVLTVMRYDEY